MRTVVKRLTDEDEDALQSLLNAASDYTRRMAGRSPAAGDAATVLEGRPESVDRKDKFGFGLWLGTELIAFTDVLRGYPSDEVAYVGLIVAHPNYQRRGVGRELHAALLHQLRAWHGIRRMRLSIVATNAAAANPFWSALGYAPTGETKAFRRDDGLETVVEFWERSLP